MTEIDIRRADSLTASLAEPEPTLTLSQVRALLADAAAYERASRPIVLRGPEQPVTAAHAAPQTAGHPGISVTLPAAAQPAPASARLFIRPEVVGYSAASAGGTAAGCGIASLFTTSPMVWGVACLGALLVSFGGAVAAHVAHGRHEQQHGARARTGIDTHGHAITEA